MTCQASLSSFVPLQAGKGAAGAGGAARAGEGAAGTKAGEGSEVGAPRDSPPKPCRGISTDQKPLIQPPPGPELCLLILSLI